MAKQEICKLFAEVEVWNLLFIAINFKPIAMMILLVDTNPIGFGDQPVKRVRHHKNAYDN